MQIDNEVMMMQFGWWECILSYHLRKVLIWVRGDSPKSSRARLRQHTALLQLQLVSHNRIHHHGR